MCQMLSDNKKKIPHSEISMTSLNNSKTKRNSRLKFWELSSSYHCAALGTCLTLKELRQLGKKAHIKDIDSWDDYQLHVSFLKTLDSKCYLSTQVNKLLDKKYKINTLYFSKTKSEAERIKLWNEAVSSGDIAGAFWAILTHPDSTDDILYKVYGKVHMLSHISGATARIDMREFHRLDKQNNSLHYQIDANEEVFNKKLNQKEKHITQLKMDLSELETENKALKNLENELNQSKDSSYMQQLQDELTTLEVQLDSALSITARLERESKKWEVNAIKEQEKAQLLERQLVNAIEEKTSVELTLSNLLVQDDKTIDDCDACPNTNPDLCGRCVLYIGGRNSQYSHFRQLVEQQNGAFIHHDGGREDSPQKLAGIVSKADVVVCPLDCVSHNAMNAVKRHCQNNTKQLVFIPHASLSAFSKGLTEVLN